MNNRRNDRTRNPRGLELVGAAGGEEIIGVGVRGD